MQSFFPQEKKSIKKNTICTSYTNNLLSQSDLMDHSGHHVPVPHTYQHISVLRFRFLSSTMLHLFLMVQLVGKYMFHSCQEQIPTSTKAADRRTSLSSQLLALSGLKPRCDYRWLDSKWEKGYTGRIF